MSSEIYRQACDLTESSRVCSRHTFYQLRHFVLGKELTTQAKMQKCLREIEARKNSMKSMILGIEEAEDELQVLGLKAALLEKKKEKNELHREYKAIQKRKLARKKAMLQDTIGEMRQKLLETEEETSFFLSAYRQLEKIEPLKRHDDPEANAQYWNENFAQELQLRLLLQKPLDLEFVKCVLAMHSEAPTRKEMIGILEQIQNRALLASEQARLASKEKHDE